MKKRAYAQVVKLIGMALLTGALIVPAVFGQAVSQITGTAKDPSGAAVPGVQITATQTDTGITRTTTTDGAGNYILPNLPLGPYKLEATKMGFQNFVQTGIQLQVDSAANIPITLAVGDVTQTVEVEANASQVETEKLGVGTVMESQRVLDLPLNGRIATDLIALTPGSVQAANSPSYGMNTGVQISIAGGQTYGVFYGLDGASHMNMYDATNMPFPFPDALQEFKVDTSTQGAGAGVHSGGQVNGVTKSGTNGFHGDGFEFFRNGDLNARNFFSPTQDTLKRNQFGGTIGGPIKKNKIFFFFAYQGTTLRQTPSPSTNYVPTAQMLTGDLSTFESAACNNGHAVTLGAPYQTINGVPDQLPASQISPVALKIASYLPPAQNACGLFLSSNLVSQYFWQMPIRIDYQLNDKQMIFARYMGTKQNQADPYSLSPNNLLTSTGNSVNDYATDAVLGHTWLISPTKVNSIRLAFNRVDLLHDSARFFGPTDVGINAYTYLPKTMSIGVTGDFTVGSGTAEYVTNHNTFMTANDDFTWIHGSHQFAFGVDESHSVIDILASVRAIGNYADSGAVTGSNMGDFFDGLLTGPSAIRESAPNTLFVHQWFFGAYAQDTWKVNSRFTLNYGLRWEPFFPIDSNNNTVYTFSLARFYAGTTSTVWKNAPPGFYYPGDPGFNGKSGINGSWRNFEPRIGLAYDPFGDGKTSIRAGAGIAYDFINEQEYHNEDNVAPFSGDTQVPGPISMANPWATLPGGNPFPYVSSPPIGRYPAAAVFLPIDPNIQTTTVYNWNVSLQRQFTPRWFASASYIGSHTIHIWDNVEDNPAQILPVPTVASSSPLCTATTLAVNCLTNLNARRLLNVANPTAASGFSELTAFDSGGTAGYNGMVLSTTWQATRDLYVNANYTWSHCISISDIAGAGTANPGTNYPHLNDRNLDVGNCSTDRRNVINITAIAQTPQFSNKLLHTVATGWQFSPIFRYSSGAWLNVTSGIDNALLGYTTERPNQVLPNVYSSNQLSACANAAPCVQWLNPAAFAQPTLGTLGNMGAYSVLGPHFVQFDAALVRTFPLREHINLQFRFEVFNVFNNVRFNAGSTGTSATNPTVGLSSTSTFGNITSAGDPRILQLAMKFNF
jgi:hypothetical protein